MKSRTVNLVGVATLALLVGGGPMRGFAATEVEVGSVSVAAGGQTSDGSSLVTAAPASAVGARVVVTSDPGPPTPGAGFADGSDRIAAGPLTMPVGGTTALPSECHLVVRTGRAVVGIGCEEGKVIAGHLPVGDGAANGASVEIVSREAPPAPSATPTSGDGETPAATSTPTADATPTATPTADATPTPTPTATETPTGNGKKKGGKKTKDTTGQEGEATPTPSEQDATRSYRGPDRTTERTIVRDRQGGVEIEDDSGGDFNRMITNGHQAKRERDAATLKRTATATGGPAARKHAPAGPDEKRRDEEAIRRSPGTCRSEVATRDDGADGDHAAADRSDQSSDRKRAQKADAADGQERETRAAHRRARADDDRNDGSRTDRGRTGDQTQDRGDANKAHPDADPCGDGPAEREAARRPAGDDKR